MTRRVFVFGSNLAGRHGAGSALEAVRNHGAIRGLGEGIQGNSYAIPTKDWSMATLPLSDISISVWQFLFYARSHPSVQFDVVKIGCGLAGYKPYQIIPMFANAPSNVHLPKGWRK